VPLDSSSPEGSAPPEEEPTAQDLAARAAACESPHFDVLVIGASTGGPPTIQRILEDLGSVVPVPVVIVQHMPKGFTLAFAERLNSHLPLQVREARDDERLVASTVYIAPAGLQCYVREAAGRYTVDLEDSPAADRHKPSVDVLFESAAEAAGRRTLALLLTGMGTDGAKGMAKIAAAGGYTLAQDAESCVVYGMPRAAQRLGVVRESGAATQLGGRLLQLLADERRPL
jgi:two-component system, chemotaxis family, protein-glutamate methylesterase/glutaminase